MKKETQKYKIYHINQALIKLLTNMIIKDTHKFNLVTERSFIIIEQQPG